ncbi:hypothetical protein BDR22DRAFT_885054 [Usnea florida]
MATRKTATMRRKNLKSRLRRMSKIAASEGGKSHIVAPHNHSPIILGRRVVLRSHIPVSIEVFLRLHKLYKEDSIRATSVFTASMIGDDGEPTRRINVALRCAIQELWEDRLKTTAQSVGALPPDPDLTMFTQQIFEQFWKAHGYPNEAEIDLLEQVGDVDAEVVDAWFQLKDCRLRTYRLMQEVMKAMMVNTLLGQKDWKQIVKRGLKIKKPYIRH